VFRILVAAFLTIYLTARAPVFLRLVDRPAASFEPIGALAWIDGPLPDTVVRGALFLTIALSAIVLIGVGHRVTGPLLGISVLLLLTYRSSWGQILWFEILIALHVLIVGFSPSANALSLRSRKRAGREASISYGWPLRLAAIVTITTYVVAGIAKLRYGGIDWLTDESMRNHIAFSAVRLEVLGANPSPVAAPILNVPLLGGLISWFVVALELFAPVAFLGPRLRWAWIGATWLMHVVIAVTMFVVFPVPLFGVAFAPLLRLESVLARWS